MQNEGLPWKKHPNPSSHNQYLAIPKRSTNPSVHSRIPSNGTYSRIPMTVSNRNKLKDDDMILSSSDVEERAKNIVLSQMKIVGNSGKVRVARNQLLDEESHKSSSTDFQDKEDKLRNIEAKENQVDDSRKEPEIIRTQSGESSSTINQHHTQSIFSFSTALQKKSYEFKPPAAAKYFLWDNSRIGPTLFAKPADFVFHLVKITPSSLKSVRMEILKAGLLTRAQSTLCPPSILGVFMGKPLLNKEANQWELELNRFEAGEKSSGMMVGDILVYCVWSQVSVQDGFNYIDLLEKVKMQRMANPLENLQTLFPIFAHFQCLEGGEVSLPSFRMVIPNYSLEMYPIHEIRLVNTTLSHKLLTELSISQAEYGVMSIDQARQLYLLPWTSTSIDTIPLIGVWIKSEYHTFKQDLLRKTCMRYIDNQRIGKLDTGKSHLLVYYFNTETPSRPECFECTFTMDKDRPFLLYGTIKNPFDLIPEKEPGFEFALNQVFSIPIKIPNVPLIIDEENMDKNAKNEPVEELLIMPAQESVQILEHTSDTEGVEDDIKQEQANANIEKREIEKAEVILKAKPSLADESEIKPLATSITTDMLSQQMMYINMLQQQIATLQSQMLSISSGQMNGLNGASSPGFGNPFWMQQMQYQQKALPAQSLDINVSLNPIDHQAEVQPRAESMNDEKHVCLEPLLNESVSTQVEFPRAEIKNTLPGSIRENLKNTQDEQIQVTFIMPQTQSIGTNTSFYFQTEMKRVEQTDQSITTTDLKNDFEKVSFRSASLQDLTHAPTDNGKNYEVYAPFSAPDEFEKPDKSACDIIAGLVEDAEKSFYHTDREDLSISMPCTTIFAKSKPQVKLSFKRPLIAAEIQRKPTFLDTSVLTGDSRDSSLLRGFDTRESSFRLETSETEDCSLSFATLKYLEKYGL